jgi:hypothetical protein
MPASVGEASRIGGAVPDGKSDHDSGEPHPVGDHRSSEVGYNYHSGSRERVGKWPLNAESDSFPPTVMTQWTISEPPVSSLQGNVVGNARDAGTLLGDDLSVNSGLYRTPGSGHLPVFDTFGHNGAQRLGLEEISRIDASPQQIQKRTVWRGPVGIWSLCALFIPNHWHN